MSSITDDLHAMREHYDQPPLRRADLHASPFIQFSKWLEDAVKAKIYDPNACSLATVDGQANPSPGQFFSKPWKRAVCFLHKL